LTRVADEKISNQEIFRKLIPPKLKSEVTFTVSNVPQGNYRLRLWTVGFEKNDAYSAYLRLGAPSQLNREQEKILRANASGVFDSETIVSVGVDGIFTKTLSLRENEVMLLKLDRQ
jgi:xylan 1,4-beta-xylosidase